MNNEEVNASSNYFCILHSYFFIPAQIAGSLKFPARSTARTEMASGKKLLKPRMVWPAGNTSVCQLPLLNVCNTQHCAGSAPPFSQCAIAELFPFVMDSLGFSGGVEFSQVAAGTTAG